MSSSKQLEAEVTVAPSVAIDHEVAAANRKQASGFVSRADVDNLRDDPEAKAAFLATFSAEEEKRIMRKVDKCFILWTGIRYMIKQVRSCILVLRKVCLLMRMLKCRLTSIMRPM